MRGCLAYLLAPVALAACATESATRIETVEVVKEVQRPCPGERPARPAKIGALPIDLAQLAAVLGAKLAEWSDPGKYADQADAIFDRCLTE